METKQQDHIEAKPGTIARPTYWPFLLAVSLLLFGWGLLTSWIISIVGVAGMCISIRGWIKEMIYERQSETGDEEELSD
jgi:hypothetical protein